MKALRELEKKARPLGNSVLSDTLDLRTKIPPGYFQSNENNRYFWDYIDRNRVWEQYRIQKGKRVPDDITAEKKAEGSRARFTVSPVFMSISLYILRLTNGADAMDVTKAGLPASGALGMVWQLVTAFLLWDFILFWVHATLHYFPYLYKTIHKKQ